MTTPQNAAERREAVSPGLHAESGSNQTAGCTCLRFVDGLGKFVGKVARDPECPTHGVRL